MYLPKSSSLANKQQEMVAKKLFMMPNGTSLGIASMMNCIKEGASSVAFRGRASTAARDLSRVDDEIDRSLVDGHNLWMNESWE